VIVFGGNCNHLYFKVFLLYFFLALELLYILVVGGVNHHNLHCICDY